MRWRAIQPAVFGIAALSFLLPFAHVSCSTDSDAGRTGSPPFESSGLERWELKGYELLVGRYVDERLAEGFALDEQDVRFGGEPFAVLAFAAALAGIGFSLVRSDARRASATLGAASAGALAAIVLGLAPVARTYGLIRVEWKGGYWTCLALFLVATAVSYLAYRDARPPPYRR